MARVIMRRSLPVYALVMCLAACTASLTDTGLEQLAADAAHGGPAAGLGDAEMPG